MKVSSTTALIRELKPFNMSFFSTNEPNISWLKRQFLQYFEDRLPAIKVRPEVYEKSAKQ